MISVAKLSLFAILIILLFLPSAWSMDYGWSPIGPYGGTIWSIAVDPNNTETVYAGTWFGGIFKSSDFGNSWETINGEELINDWVRTIAIDPNTSAVYVSNPYGLYKSTNGGVNWTYLGHLNAFISSIAVDPNDNNIVYVGIRSDSSMYKSVNGGQDWFTVNNGLEGNEIEVIAIDPNNSNVLYVGTRSTDGAYKSIDGGLHWSCISTGMDIVARAIAIDPYSSETIYIGSSIGVFKSTDAGTSWVAKNNGLLSQDISFLFIHPESTTVIYASNYAGIHRSNNGADNWIPVGSYPSHRTVLSLSHDPSNPERIYVGYYHAEGLFRSDSLGVDWTELSIPNTDITSIGIPASLNNIIYAGSRSGTCEAGIFKSTDGGAHWIELDVNGVNEVAAISIDPLQPEVLYACAKEAVFKTTDGGNNWTPTAPAGGGCSVTSLAIDPNATETIYAGLVPDDWGLPYGLYKSIDGGLTWSVMNNGAPAPNGDGVLCFVLDPQNSNIIYAGWGSGIYKSTDAGTTWASASMGLPFGSVYALAINPSNSSILYAGLGSSELFKTINGGDSWFKVSDALVEYGYISSIVINNANPDELHAATFPSSTGGVFRSQDGGTSWHNVNEGLSSISINTLALDPSNNNLIYAGSRGAGILVGSSFTNSIDDENDALVNDFSLYQNYPNPFNSETTINYYLPKASNVVLAIYNISGQQVKVLANEKQSKGFHTVNWDGKDRFCNNVSSGIYFCRLQAGAQFHCSKMLLLK